MRSSTIRGRAAAAIFALGCAVVLGVSLHVHFKPYAYEPEPVGVDPDWYSPSEELASAGQYGMGFLNHDCAGADPEVVDREAARALELLERYSDDEILQHALGAGRVVVTHDRDFGALALRAHAPCVGIIFLRPAHIVAAFTLDTLAAIDTLDLDLQAPFLLVADRRGEDVRIRVRSLDPG